MIEVDIFLLKQLLLLTAICMMTFATGIHLAFPSILNLAILAPDAVIKATSDQASWIAACLGIGGLVGCTFIPVIFEIFGRKIANIASNIFMFIGSLMLYVANDIYFLAVARLIQGISFGGTFITVMTICECVPPKRRGYFMAINKVSLAFGSLACHGLGFILNWRQIMGFSALPNCLAIILLMITAESPSFFAKRVKFNKCEKVFKWYRGDSLHANKELNELLAAQTENSRLKQKENNISIFKKSKDILLTKEFRKSFYIVTLATLCIDSCGRVFTLAYITQILLDITYNQSLAMYMSVAFDCVLIFTLCISCVLVKHFERRTLLFRLGFSSVFLMFMISLTIILKNNLMLFQDIKWLIPTVLLLHTFITNVALVPIAFALTGEIFSLDHKCLGSFMSGFVFLFFFNVVMKVTPIMMEKIGVEGTYSIYGLCLLIFLILLRLILPETKDKTLQTIEDEIKGIVRNNAQIEFMEVNPK